MLGRARRGEISRWRRSLGSERSPGAVVPAATAVAAAPRAFPFLGGVFDRAFHHSFGGRHLGLHGGLARLVDFLLIRLFILLRLQEVGRVEEGALFLTDVDEGRLDAGENRFDSSEVNVTDRPAVVGTVHQQFDQPIVFQDCHARFPLASIDQDFTLQYDLSRGWIRYAKDALVGWPAPPNEEHAARARLLL